MTASTLSWQAGRFRLAFERPLVMGIVNLTPDSFSDGGRSLDASLRHCEALVADGADLLDLGGESTRPGAKAIDDHEEIERVVPVLRHALSLNVPVSIDTRRAAVMEAVLCMGADIINDVSALRAPGAVEVMTRYPRAGICLMHMRGDPQMMQKAPVYADVVRDVRDFLEERAQVALAAGIARERLCVDPGIGFGKTADHNLALLRRQGELTRLGLPLLVGWSRKSTLGHVTGRDVNHRLPASLAAALLSAMAGANVLRVHDVAATVDVLKVWRAAMQP